MNTFFSDKRKRNTICKDKDQIIKNLLQTIDIINPKQFNAILMPNLYGIELFHLLGQGVPNENLFAIERDPNIHSKYRNPRYQHLANISTSRIPMNISDAIDVCWYRQKKWDLIYLDFLSRITADQIEAMDKIARLQMVKPGGMLIVTFGKTRTHRYSVELEKCMDDSGCDLVAELIQMPHQIHHYLSHVGNNKKIEYKTYAFSEKFQTQDQPKTFWINNASSRRSGVGAGEWGESINCARGCSHDCRYCYAREMAVKRFKRIKPEDWLNMETYDNPKSKRKHSGTVMFPTTHDICPEILDKALSTLQNLLDAKNEVLVVTKPHLECVVAICEKFKDNKNLSFRFTIGSSNNDILQTWEPGATLFEERFECLQHAFGLGFSTSISIEPILDVFGVESLVETLKPFVTDTIWLGKMNRVSSRSYDIDPSEIERIKSEQTRDNLISLRDKLDYPMIRWSELTKRFLNKDKK